MKKEEEEKRKGRKKEFSLYCVNQRQSKGSRRGEKAEKRRKR
jgi:hypothetical protein